MSDKNYAIIHFIDGTTLKLEFPKQDDDVNFANRMQKFLESQWLMIDADGSLLMIPVSSIKYIQSHPRPAILPDSAVKGATLVS